MDSVFILFHLAAYSGLKYAIFDVTAAFLEGDADAKLYCRLPACMSESNIPQRVQILRNMYGEKQAGKVWNDRLHEILSVMGYDRCPYDACLYMKYVNIDNFVMMSIHVDDAFIVSPEEVQIRAFYKEILGYICLMIMKITY
jgi:hypothetical protein